MSSSSGDSRDLEPPGNCVYFFETPRIKVKQFFGMLMWETASINVLMENESEKATATTYIFLTVFFVLVKFYKKMNKHPLLLSARLKKDAKVKNKKNNHRPGSLFESSQYYLTCCCATFLAEMIVCIM